MSFANPIGLLLLLAVPVIVLLHLFRQERRRQEVSSLYLWREISDQHSRRMRPRLLRNVNLLLQIAAAILAALALAEPSLDAGTSTAASEIILVVDDSASMQAASDGVERMELARNRAREIVGRAPRNARIMLATAGPQPRVVQTFTTDRATIYEAIRALEASDGANELESAMELVRGLAAGPSTTIVLVSDGAVPRAALGSIGAGVELATVGAQAVADGGDGAQTARPTPVNVAITSFELRERPNGSAFEVLSGVANYSPDATSVEYELSADGEIVSRRGLELEPGEKRLITAVIPRTRGTVYAARLVDNVDALAADDRAFAATAGERPVRVQLASRGNLFLESFLAVYPNVALTVTDTVSQASSYDILVLDRVSAPAGLRGNVVAFGSVLPDGPFAPIEVVEREASVSQRSTHPIGDDVRLDQIQVSSYARGELNPRATILAATGEDPLLYTFRRDDLTLVGTTFPLSSSDIALRGAFPVLMHNIIEWLAPVSPAGDVGYARAGEPVPLYVPPGEQIVVIAPDGTPTRFTPRSSPFQFTGTNRVGVYEVRGSSFQSRFAVSLADAAESNLANRLGAATRTGSETSTLETTGTPLWPTLALLALLVLTVDWVVWARRH